MQDSIFSRLENRRTALLQLGVVGEALLHLGNLDLVKVAMHFLSVAGDEGNGVAFLQELSDRRHLSGGNTQLGAQARKHLRDIRLCTHYFY